MINNKERILRNLEYISGGITTLKMLCKAADSPVSASYYELCNDWQDILCETIYIIEEDNENA